MSVVETERLLESGSFRAKLAQENLLNAGSIPHTIVRARQFFEFVKQIADFGTMGNEVHLPLRSSSLWQSMMWPAQWPES
jgi:hypothetical protein